MSDFLEKTLENIIFSNKNLLSERGLPIKHEHLMKQVLLPSGKYIDLFGFDIHEQNIECTIYELKKEKLTWDALSQIARYSVELRYTLEPFFETVVIHKTLIGNDCDKALAFLNNEVFTTELFTYEYKMDGIWFYQLAKTLSLAGTDTGYNVFQPKSGSENFVYALLDKAGLNK